MSRNTQLDDAQKRSHAGGVADDAAWKRNGDFFGSRRTQLGMGKREAQRAIRVKADSTWRRLEDGEHVSIDTLYSACNGMLLSDDEARGVFENLGETYDPTKRQRPEPLVQLAAALKIAEEALADAHAAQVQLEALMRAKP